MAIVLDILSQKLKRPVEVDEFLEVDIDLALANDITAPLAIKEFKKRNIKEIKRDKVVIVIDHFSPAKDKESANQIKLIDEFVKEFKIKKYFPFSVGGIEHIVLPQEGLIKEGDFIIGADSHTTTYGALCALAFGVGSSDFLYAIVKGKTWLKVPPSIKVRLKGRLKEFLSGKDVILELMRILSTQETNAKALEFEIKEGELSLDDKFTICNMVQELGADFGIFEGEKFKTKQDKEYQSTLEIELNKLDFKIAKPHFPSNVVNLEEVTGVEINKVFIGSCTNGRLKDLREVAKILAAERVVVETIIIPGSWKIYKEAIKEGIIETLIESGCIICPPSCGPCLGGHLGVLADGDVCLSSSNRNFKGRMGSTNAQVYLANVAVCAASALKGRITSPYNR